MKSDDAESWWPCVNLTGMGTFSQCLLLSEATSPFMSLRDVEHDQTESSERETAGCPLVNVLTGLVNIWLSTLKNKPLRLDSGSISLCHNGTIIQEKKGEWNIHTNMYFYWHWDKWKSLIFSLTALRSLFSDYILCNPSTTLSEERLKDDSIFQWINDSALLTK